MTERGGDVIYWSATTIAGLVVMLAVVSYVLNVREGQPVFPIVPLLLAGAIWLVGYFCRRALTSR